MICRAKSSGNTEGGVINELIELAKRYDDEWSPKLLNGIMHKVFNNIEA